MGFVYQGVGDGGGFSAANIATAPAFTYFVDNVGGLDTNPGTQSQPWATITKVNATVVANQSVGFKRGGTYNGQITPGADGITYGAYGSGANPIINGNVAAQCVLATSRNNLTFQSLRLTAGGTYGIAADICNGLILSGLEIDHANSSGIILGNGTQNVTITGCLIHDNGVGASGDRDGIGIGGGGAAAHHITISGCDIYANFNDNIRVSMTSAFNTPNNITITNNTVRNSVAGSGIAADACNVLTITFNVVTNNTAGVGIYAVPASDGTHVENVQAVIYNNTVVGNLWGIFATNGANGTFNVTVKNNLCQNNGTSGSSAEMAITTLTTWASDYNLVFHAAGGNFMYAASYMTWATWKTTVTPNDANSKNTDPLMNPDYTLKTGSPALGAGIFIAGVNTVNPPNIGAK
jgi:hypothetical protein